MQHWCLVAYRSKPTADGRRVSAEAEVSIRPNAPVLLRPPKFPHMTVTVGRVTEPLLEWLDGEIWARLDFLDAAEVLPSGNWFPEIDLGPDTEAEWQDEFLWFHRFEVVGITLDRNPAWTGIRPITLPL